MPNRLAHETSPYLLQHKDNPVDWYPWGEEAFDKARLESKPIFLSVGYSSCHWCHVMEHESFEDAEVADILNRKFVSVKVDREERPDIDDAYMTAVQLSSGRGGWPMSVLMTPEREPFFAGTYIPKEPRGGHPGLIALLEQLADIWQSDQSKIREIASQFATAMRQSIGGGGRPMSNLSERFLDACVAAHIAEFDEEHGGFGGAPKFPPHTAIELLLNYAISDFGDETSRNTAADMALFTLEKMALGGLHDHVGGGFHRYSTDDHWLLPHFEKMLYDNALMLGNYARAAALCHEQIPELEVHFSRAANGIVRWLKSEMTSSEGLFYSALDADSEGEEGKYYVWTDSEVDAVLGVRGAQFRKEFQFHSQGNFRDEASGETNGTNIPHLIELTGEEFDADLARLNEARTKRVRPGLDDKAIVAWNGLMIAALSEAAELDLAESALNAILKHELEFGKLPHQIAGGRASGEAFLEDYAYLIDGITALAGVKALFEGEGAKLPGLSASDLLTVSKRLMEEMIAKFQDPATGGYFSTSQSHEELFGRSMPIFDQPMPSGNAIAAKCMVELGDRDRALAVLRAVGGWMEHAPMATECLHLVLMRLLSEGSVTADSTPPNVVVRVPYSDLMAINGVAEGVVEFEVPEGWHVNSAAPEAKWLVPTEITFEPAIGHAMFPEAVDDRYVGQFEIPFRIDLDPGKGASEVQLTVRFQACSEQECDLPSEEKFVVVVRAG